MRDDATTTSGAGAEGEAAHARRIPAVAEVLGYAGGGLALAALLTLLAMYWAMLGVWGRTAIAAGVAIAGLAGGYALERVREPAARRLSGFLLLIGVAGVGGAVGFVTHRLMLNVYSASMGVADASSKASDWAWFAGFAALALSGGIVWWGRRTWLQHLAFGVGVGVGALLALPLVPVDGPGWGAGVVLALVGVAWGALSLRGALPPENAGLALASIGILGGIQIMALADAGGVREWPVWLGMAASIGLVVLGALLRRYVLVGFGAAGLVLYAIQLVSEVYELGMGTPVALVGAGLLLLGVVVCLVRRTAAENLAARRVAVEVAGYVGIAFLLAGVTMLMSEYFDRIGPAGRIAIPLVAAAVAYGTALLVERAGTDSSRRLSQTLFAAGAVALAAFAGMVTFEIADTVIGPPPTGARGDQYVPYRDAAQWALLVASLTALIVGGITYWLRKGVVTMLVPGVASSMVVFATVGIVAVSTPAWIGGSLLLMLGLGWLLLGLADRLVPGTAAVAIGCVLSIMAVTMLQNDERELVQYGATVLGLGLSLAAIWASIRLKRGVLLGFGAAGVVLFSFLGVQMFFEGRIGAPIALLIVGVIFIGMAVLVAVVLPRVRRPDGAGADSV